MKLIAWLLIFTFPSTILMAESSQAMLVGSGAVQINGELGAHSSTLFSGDKIQTAANAFALIKSPTGLLSVQEDSAITYEGNSINFERGAVVVDTPKGMSAHFGKLTISASPDKPAKFELVNAQGVEKVVALAGSIKVSEGTHLAKLSAGQALVRGAYEQPEETQYEFDPQKKDKDKDKDEPVAENIPGWMLVFVTLAPIAAIGAIGIAGGFNGISPVSPSTLH